MGFGRRYQVDLTLGKFPEHWLDSAVQYVRLKKCLRDVQRELTQMELDTPTTKRFATSPNTSIVHHETEVESEESDRLARPVSRIAAQISTPQPLPPADGLANRAVNEILAQVMKASFGKLRQHLLPTAGARSELCHALHQVRHPGAHICHDSLETDKAAEESTVETKCFQVCLTSVKHLFDVLGANLGELQALNQAESRRLELEILDLGDMLENSTQPVRQGYETTREVHYRELYIWREIFLIYMKKPVFYTKIESCRGALSYGEASKNLEAYVQQLHSSGLLSKVRAPMSWKALRHFLDINMDIARIIHFQTINARVIRKILEVPSKRSYPHDRRPTKAVYERCPTLLATSSNSGSALADSIGHDLQAELDTKVLAIVPQLKDWSCPVCLDIAWRPVRLDCCRAIFCIRCITRLRDHKVSRCPCCNMETVITTDKRDLDFETMEFLLKFFPLEVDERQMENERALLEESYAHSVKEPSACTVS